MRSLETRDTLTLSLTYHHCWCQTLPLRKKCLCSVECITNTVFFLYGFRHSLNDGIKAQLL